MVEKIPNLPKMKIESNAIETDIPQDTSLYVNRRDFIK